MSGPRCSAPQLLLVEDDRALGPLLVEILAQSYQVQHVCDGQAGLHAALTARFDLMVVDRGLPGIEGSDLVRRLRRAGNGTPALILTARASVSDRIEGLDAGAEDYLVKPFDIDELLARLRALVRRHDDSADVLELGPSKLDVPGRRVIGGARDADLSGKETLLLAALARRPQRVFSRPELMASVFEPGGDPGTVDTYVYYLRRKLGREAINTIHGLGYRLGSV